MTPNRFRRAAAIPTSAYVATAVASALWCASCAEVVSDSTATTADSTTSTTASTTSTTDSMTTTDSTTTDSTTTDSTTTTTDSTTTTSTTSSTTSTTTSTTSTTSTDPCDAAACAPEQLCVVPACQQVMGEECYLTAPDDTQVCPPGEVRAPQFDGDCPDGAFACVSGCPAPPAFCVDLPAGCNGAPMCACLASDPCAASNSGACHDEDIAGHQLACSLKP